MSLEGYGQLFWSRYLNDGKTRRFFLPAFAVKKVLRKRICSVNETQVTQDPQSAICQETKFIWQLVLVINWCLFQKQSAWVTSLVDKQTGKTQRNISGRWKTWGFLQVLILVLVFLKIFFKHKLRLYTFYFLRNRGTYPVTWLSCDSSNLHFIFRSRRLEVGFMWLQA